MGRTEHNVIMYLDIYGYDGKLKKRTNDILGGISWSVELMEVPTMDLTLPIDYLEYINGREEVKLYVNNKCFFGRVIDIDVNKDTETIDLEIEHIIGEWQDRQISINNAVKSKTLNIVYPVEKKKSQKALRDKDDKIIRDENGNAVYEEIEDFDYTQPSLEDQLDTILIDNTFVYAGWSCELSEHAKEKEIEYVFSRESKLEALTRVCELTSDLFWRVTNIPEKIVEIGEFGVLKPYIISKKPSGKTNIEMLTEPEIDYDFRDVINVATVYSNKSDTGMSNLTLREVYSNPSLQDKNFPVVILKENVNNERNYNAYITQFPKLASNNRFEYAIIDKEGVALEGGKVVEGSFAFDDLNPFSERYETDVEDDQGKVTKRILDKDRIRASVDCYEGGKRKLKNSRRTISYTFDVTELPADICVGDKVRMIYDNNVLHLEACSNYMKKIYTENDEFYITSIDYNIDETGTEIDTITLNKYLKIDRETKEI